MESNMANDDTLADVESTLAALDEAYQRAKEKDPDSFDEPPDGTYDVYVDTLEFKKSQNGNRYLNWQLKIIGPKCSGRVLFKKSMLQTESNMDWLKTDLKMCGLDLKSLKDLPTRLQDLLDVALQVRKVAQVGTTFYNIHFKKRLPLSAADVQKAAAGKEPDHYKETRDEGNTPF
jgi:hypothetical protein